jgi:hypothetical protein
MAFDNSYTAVTGGTLSAAQWNTHVRDNFTAVWPYTTAGDIVYATSSTTLTRLAPPASDSLLTYDLSATAPVWLASSSDNALKFLRVKSTGDEFEFASGGISTTDHYDATGHNYSANVWRDMPNSEITITPAQTSTVIVQGSLFGNCGSGSQNAQFRVRIDTTDGDYIGQANDTTYFNMPLTALFSGVTAASHTIKLREFQEFNGNTYYIYRMQYNVFIIPE